MNKFAFGKNWQRYLKMHNPKRLEVAKKSITDFMSIENLKGKLFLDVGCGSGYFSLAAIQLGADVISFDIDLDCIKCCQFFKKKLVIRIIGKYIRDQFWIRNSCQDYHKLMLFILTAFCIIRAICGKLWKM